jgi:beta-lactam-binding protein with PASTA domain
MAVGLARWSAQSSIVLAAVAAVGFGAGWVGIAVAHGAGASRRLLIMPTVDGRSAANASADPKAAGLKPGRSSQSSTTVAEGEVISTDPAGGTRAQKGSAVTMLVSRGP